MDIAGKLGFSHIRWDDDHLVILDQRKLPVDEIYLDIRTVEEAKDAIANLTVRGAPLIGITAAYGLCLLPNPHDKDSFDKACRLLKDARPTAVNLSWAVNRMAETYYRNVDGEDLRGVLIDEALRIHDEDKRMCDRIGAVGNEIVPDHCRILTHCNAGALATGGIGTALAVIYTAYYTGKRIEVWVDETRPVLQGARLTAWELSKANIPFKLITDNAAGQLMFKGEVDMVIVGADRIAKNFDFANKIGTYSLAVLAKYHEIPFYVAAPSSTFDMNCPDGGSIVIEKRHPDEVRFIGGRAICPPTAPAYNMAFDVTSHELVTGIITEKEIIRPGR